ncbi:MAG: hypothetical protein HQL52_20175 [Magnetococcales bacterium]|nr:hypothetical protein [Magnetococcales bacterium]
MSAEEIPEQYRVYGALTEDINNIALSISPEAAHALRRHDQFVAAFSKVRQPILDKIIKQETGLQAYNLAVTGDREGGRRLWRLRKSFNPQEWDIVAGSTLYHMGLGRPSHQDILGTRFSHAKFLTEWSRLSPQAKGALFSGNRYASIRPELDRLARVSAALKDVDEAVNWSNTAQQQAFMGLIQRAGAWAAYGGVVGGAGAMFGMVEAASALLTPYAMAKLWTNPKFIKWLARSSQAGLNVEKKNMKRFLAGQVGRLTTLTQDEQEIREEVKTLTEFLKKGI